MILSIIGTLLCLSSLIWVVIGIFSYKKREYITTDVSFGLICPSCKEDIYDRKEIHLLSECPHHVQLCKKCQRDSALDVVLDKKKINIFAFIFSKNWKFYFFAMCIVSISLQIFNLFIYNSWLHLMGGVVLFLAQLFNYINFIHITRVKKTQSR
jgi:hypothetical protein